MQKFRKVAKFQGKYFGIFSITQNEKFFCKHRKNYMEEKYFAATVFFLTALMFSLGECFQ